MIKLQFHNYPFELGSLESIWYPDNRIEIGRILSRLKVDMSNSEFISETVKERYFHSIQVTHRNSRVAFGSFIVQILNKDKDRAYSAKG